MFTYLLSYMTPQKMLIMGRITGEGSHQTTVESIWDRSSTGEMAMIASVPCWCLWESDGL
ncbi:MAG: hypothetical protein ACLVGL_07010 [Waltera sp.]